MARKKKVNLEDSAYRREYEQAAGAAQPPSEARTGPNCETDFESILLGISRTLIVRAPVHNLAIIWQIHFERR